MAANFSMTLAGTVTGEAAGSETISITFNNSSSPGLCDLVTLTTTSADITPADTTTRFLLIVPPTTNTATLQLHIASGVTHDASKGTTLHPTNPILLPLPTSGQHVFMSASASTIVQLKYL